MRTQGAIVRLFQRSRLRVRREAVVPVQLLQHRLKSSLANVDLDDMLSTTPPTRSPPPFPAESEGPLRTSQLIKYDQSHSGPSLDRMVFDEGDDLSGPVTLGQNSPGIEAGRLVEVRRNNIATLGLILCSVLVNDRPRILLLRGTGEIWVAGSNDIQFVMPASLVPASLAAECWSPELIQLWASGREIGLSGSQEEEELVGAGKAVAMLDARRKIGTIIRRVQRETERMTSALARGGIAAGVGGWTEAVWEHYAPKDDPSKSNTISSAEVAELLLNQAANGTCDPTSPDYIAVRPNTLPAFGAHIMLMDRGDLFLAEARNMWNDGTFFVRSRDDRRRLQDVWRWVDGMDPIFTDFVAKATKVRNLIAAGKADEVPEWTEDELDILHVMALSFFENRTTQAQPTEPIVSSILKTFRDVGLEETSNPNIFVQAITSAETESLLRDIGMLAPGDSHRLATLTEGVKRDMAAVHLPVVTPEAMAQPTAEDAALDSLRSDSSDRVFVIDDMSAQELDDGIALERISGNDNEFWIHTYVADPTRYVSINDPIGTHAFYQGATQYTGDGTIPLLPSQLGGGSLSLGTSKDGQTAVKLSTRVDREGNILDHKVGLSFVKNACLTTYSTVNEALNVHGSTTVYPFGRIRDEYAPRVTRPTHELTESDVVDLKTLHELAAKLRAKRFATSGFELTYPVASACGAINGGVVQPNLFDRDGLHRKPQSYGNGMLFQYAVTEDGGPNTSQRMVAELMVLANRAAAYFCHSRNLAAVFRTVGTWKNSSLTAPGLTREELLAKRLPGSGDIPYHLVDLGKLIKGTLEQRTTPGPNWVMGFDKDDHGYLRATSPLRRFDDMLAHWQIKRQLAVEAGLAGVPAPLHHATVATIETRTRKAELRTRNLEMRTREYWTSSLFRARMEGLAAYDADPNAHAYEYPDGKLDMTNLTARVLETNRNLSGCPYGAMDAVVPATGTMVVSIALTKDQNQADYAPGDTVKVRVSQVITMPNARITLEMH